MNEVIERGLRQRGINPPDWSIIESPTPIPGSQRITGERETEAVYENGRQVAYLEWWTLDIVGGRPLWEDFATFCQPLLMPTAEELSAI